MEDVNVSPRKSWTSLVVSCVVIIIAIVLGGVVGFGYGKKQTVNKSSPVGFKNGWVVGTLPKTEIKSYPIVKDGKLSLVSIADNNSISSVVVDQDVLYGNGGMFVGSTDPAVSPDIKKIAYLKAGGQAWLVSANTKDKIILSKEILFSALGPWSPDSRYLVLFSSADDVAAMYEGQGAEDYKKFEKRNVPMGVYLYDSLEGKILWLSPITNVATWVGPTKLLTLPDVNQTPYSYAIFDVQSYEVDTKTLRNSLSEWFYPQFSVSGNGRWALSLGKPGNEPNVISYAKIVMGDFPDVKGTLIEEGKWAHIQKPAISPRGDKVIYRKYDVANGPVYVEYWNGKKITRLVEGEPEIWIDENRFIYTEGLGNIMTRKSYLYDIVSNEGKLLE